MSESKYKYLNKRKGTDVYERKYTFAGFRRALLAVSFSDSFIFDVHTNTNIETVTQKDLRTNQMFIYFINSVYLFFTIHNLFATLFN